MRKSNSNIARSLIDGPIFVKLVVFMFGGVAKKSGKAAISVNERSSHMVSFAMFKKFTC